MAYLNDPIFEVKFFEDDQDFTIRQVPKEMLQVDPTLDARQVENLAKDILGWTKASKAECTIVMMHEPAVETLQDLYKEWLERYISANLHRLPTQKIVLVAGEISLMYRLIGLLRKEDYLVFCCTTERVSEEKVLPDGSTKKVSVFKHIRVRQLL
jgi:hypothetical protein